MSEQCKGITKSGLQCKMTATFPNGYCRIHTDQCSQSTADKPFVLSESAEPEKINDSPQTDSKPAPEEASSFDTKSSKKLSHLLSAIIVGTLIFILLVLTIRRRPARHIKL